VATRCLVYSSVLNRVRFLRARRAHLISATATGTPCAHSFELSAAVWARTFCTLNKECLLLLLYFYFRWRMRIYYERNLQSTSQQIRHTTSFEFTFTSLVGLHWRIFPPCHTLQNGLPTIDQLLIIGQTKCLKKTQQLHALEIWLLYLSKLDTQQVTMVTNLHQLILVSIILRFCSYCFSFSLIAFLVHLIVI